MGMEFLKNREVADLDGQSAAPLGVGSKQWILIAGIGRDPIVERSGYVVTRSAKNRPKSLLGTRRFGLDQVRLSSPGGVQNR